MPELTIVYTKDNWGGLMEAMHSGQKIEIDEEVFDYWLEVLPPVYMGKRVTLPGGEVVHATFGFAEGAEQVTAFWTNGPRHQEGNPRRFFCQRTEEMNPYA